MNSAGLDNVVMPQDIRDATTMRQFRICLAVSKEIAIKSTSQQPSGTCSVLLALPTARCVEMLAWMLPESGAPLKIDVIVSHVTTLDKWTDMSKIGRGGMINIHRPRDVLAFIDSMGDPGAGSSAGGLRGVDVAAVFPYGFSGDSTILADVMKRLRRSLPNAVLVPKSVAVMCAPVCLPDKMEDSMPYRDGNAVSSGKASDSMGMITCPGQGLPETNVQLIQGGLFKGVSKKLLGDIKLSRGNLESMPFVDDVIGGRPAQGDAYDAVDIMPLMASKPVELYRSHPAGDVSTGHISLDISFLTGTPRQVTGYIIYSVVMLSDTMYDLCDPNRTLVSGSGSIYGDITSDVMGYPSSYATYYPTRFMSDGLIRLRLKRTLDAHGTSPGDTLVLSHNMHTTSADLDTVKTFYNYIKL